MIETLLGLLGLIGFIGFIVLIYHLDRRDRRERQERRDSYRRYRQDFYRRERRRQDPDRQDRQESYRQYLQSEHWQRFRLTALRQAGYQCHACHQRLPLDIHHLNYDSLGSEEYGRDVVALCQNCHRQGHEALPT